MIAKMMLDRLSVYSCLYTLILLGISLVISPGAFGQGLGGDEKNGEKWNERRKHRLDNYRDETGRLRSDLRKKGIAKLKQMPIAAGVPAGGGAALIGPAGLDGPGLTGVQWVQIGPQPAVPLRQFNFQGFGPMSGEVVDIAIDPRGASDNVIYIATNQGGVWRSLDGGVTFTPRTDYFPTLSIGALALDRGNPSIVYAGTGNLFDGNGNRWQTSPTLGQTPNAVGIYKSSDMGQTWSIINPGNIFDSIGFGRMVSPSPGVLLAGTSGGLFRSGDYGENFGNNAPEFDNGLPIRTGNITDLDIDVNFSTTDIVYVSVFGIGVLAYNDGDTTLPASSNILTSTNGGPTNSIQFLRFAQAESDPLRMYATVEGFAANDHEVADTAPSGGADRFEGLYRSDDGGANWTRLDGSGSAEGAAERNGSRGCQCGYDQTVAVDPQDPDRVYIGLQAAFNSTDGGVSFGLSPAMSDDKIHWDQHAHYFSPPAHRSGGAPTRMWLGSDGGLHSSSDGGASFNNDHNITIASNLFTDMDMGYGSPANNAFTYGGTQDTGTLQTHPGVSDLPSTERWDMGINGDGGGVGVDTANAARAYSSGNNGYQVSTDGGANWGTPGGYVGPGTVWRYAIDYSDADNVFLVQGGNAGFDPSATLHRSTDQGITYVNLYTAGSAIQAIANTPTDQNVVWLGLASGSVVKTTDALATTPTFTAMAVNGNPGTSVGNIAINPQNTDVVAVTYRGLCGNPCNSDDNRQKRIFLTTNGGSTWVDISGTDGNPAGNLPNLPIHSAAFDSGTSPATLIVSMDGGVLRSNNLGATWEQLGVGLPTVDGTRLRIDNTAEPTLLRLATYGRSMWELQQAQGPILSTNYDLGFGTLCVGETATREVQVFNVGSEDLIINAFFRSEGSSDFSVIGGPSTPVVIAPGNQINFTVRFAPSSPGDQTAKFQINSNDQFFPQFILDASGTGNIQQIATVIANSASFGDVCTENDFRDLNLTIANIGCGTLSVSDINFTGADALDFDVPQVMSYPLTVSEGTSIEIPIRFDPSGECGTTSLATVNIDSDDPDNPTKSVDVSGTVPCPDLNLTILDSGDFGNVCLGDMSALDLELFNQGKCDLTITNISQLNAADFELPADLQFPLVMSHDSTKTIPIKYNPDATMACSDTDPRLNTITIHSDSLGAGDPENELDVAVSGLSQCPNLTIDPPLSGFLAFNPTVADIFNGATRIVDCSVVQQDVISIRNTGFCPLEISGISSSLPDFEIDSPTAFDPPIIVPVGEETLTVDVRFRPQTGLSSAGPTEILSSLTVASNSGLGGPMVGNSVLNDFLCGEGVLQSGTRLTVLDTTLPAVAPVANVDKLNLVSKGKNTPSPINIRLTNVPLQTASVCGNTIPYHLHNELLPTAGTTGSNPRSSYVADAMEGNLQGTLSFNIGQCAFVVDSIQLLSGSGGAGKPCNPKNPGCVP